MRKTKLLTTLAVLCLFLNTATANAVQLTIEWGYPGSGITEARFKEYDIQTGAVYREFYDYGEDNIYQTIDFYDNGWTFWKMTVVDQNGVESPESNTYAVFIDNTRKGPAPLTVTPDTTGAYFDFDYCPGISSYWLTITNRDNNNTVVSEGTTLDSIRKNLPVGNYTAEVNLRKSGTQLSGYGYGPVDFAIVNTPPAKPQAAMVLYGTNDAAMKLVITARSPELSIEEFHYTIYSRDKAGVKAFFANDLSLKSNNNYVGNLNLTGKTGIIVEVRAYCSHTGLESDPVTLVAQIGDLNGDRKVNATDLAIWTGNKNKTGVWNATTRNLISSPLTSILKSDLDKSGLVGNYTLVNGVNVYHEQKQIMAHMNQTTAP